MSFSIRKKAVAGKDESTAKKQFRIDPKLQRTRASGNRQGITRLTTGAKNIIQNDIVRLPNRAVPRVSTGKKKRRVGAQPR